MNNEVILQKARRKRYECRFKNKDILGDPCQSTGGLYNPSLGHAGLNTGNCMQTSIYIGITLHVSA